MVFYVKFTFPKVFCYICRISTVMKNKVKLSEKEILMGFVVSCIEDVADSIGADYLEVYRRMDAVQMIDGYIIPNYEVLHTDSRRNLTEGLIDTLKRWEGSK